MYGSFGATWTARFMSLRASCGAPARSIRCAAAVSARKRPEQVTVGFAAETHDLLDYAQRKLEKKQLDLIIANQVGGENCAFGADTAWAWLITPDAPPEQLHLITKEELTERVFDKIASILRTRNT